MSLGTTNHEYVVGALRWLAYGYHFFLNKPKESVAAYKDCLELDPKHHDCRIFLSHLKFNEGDLITAWSLARETLLTRFVHITAVAAPNILVLPM